MVENLFTKSCTRSMQLNAPLLKEREQYLAHMLVLGVSRERLRVVASESIFGSLK